MSTLKVVNIQHPSAASATLILDSSGNLALPAGSASTPALQGPSDTNTGLFFPAADTIAFAEGGTEALRIDSSGRVGIGTSSPGAPLHIVSNSSAEGIRLAGRSSDNISSFYFRNNADSSSYGLIQGRSTDFRFTSESGSQPITFHTDQERVRITGAGNVGIGTSAPVYLLDVQTTSGNGIRYKSTSTGYGLYIGDNAGTPFVSTDSASPLTFGQNNTERARIDTSGRLLVGTSSARSNFFNLASISPRLQLEGASSSATDNGRFLSHTFGRNADSEPMYIFAKHRSESVGGIAAVQSGDFTGTISFQGSDGTEFVEAANISAVIDGTPGANDMPGRLVFSVTRDGASSPTEAMRINNTGTVDVYTPASGNYAMRVLPSSGADRLVFLAGIGGVTNGFRADWVNGSSQMAYRFTDSPTTSSGANAHLDSGDNNRLYRSTSSLRYKKDIENIEQDRADAVLNLRPVWYRSKSSVDPSDWSWYGLIAEEVAEVEPRLVHWTYLEEDYDVEEVNGQLNKTLREGAQKVPDGVQYDRLAVLLLDVVKRQQQTIEVLEARVTALEAS